MDYSKINRQMMVLAVLIVTVVFFVYTRSFVDDVPNCDGYVTNVYLYVLLGLLITAFSVLFIAKRKYPITSTKSLLAFAVGIMALFSMYIINPRNVLLNHAVWIVFLLAMSVSLYVIWRYSTYSGTLTSTLIIVFLLVAGLTSIAYIKPDLVQLSWGSTLIVALVAGILAWIVPMFFGDTRNMTNYYKILSAVFVFIFMMLILYDTKLLRVKAQQCTIPDYPTDSLGLFLDIINLFGNVTMLR
jgi:FtsH-binding integral membrane protein